MDFRGTHSDPSIREMERESGSILQTTRVETGLAAARSDFGTGLSGSGRDDVQWHLQVRSGSAELRCDGAACQHEDYGSRDPVLRPGGLRSRGEYGAIGDVRWRFLDARICWWAARWVGSWFMRLVHMLTHSAEHGRDGVFEAALSGKQLIAPTLPLSCDGCGSPDVRI